MTEYEYKILYGRPNQTIHYGGKDTIENDLNEYAQKGFEIFSTHLAASVAPMTMIIMRKKL